MSTLSINNEIIEFIISNCKRIMKKRKKPPFLPISVFRPADRNFGRNVSADFDRNFGRNFGFGRTLINYKYFNYHWSTWILSFIQVWSADLNEMANQILHLLHIWITPPHQIMLTLIYQSSRANVNFPKIPCFLKEGMRCLWKWGSRSHSTKNPHFLQRKENLIFPSFHAKRLFHGDLCFQKYYIPLYVCTNEQFINSKHL